jgi:hypothetical protein
MEHFLPCARTYNASKVAAIFFFQESSASMDCLRQLYLTEMLSLLATFGRIYGPRWGLKLKFSSAFHPQTDGQTEAINWSLGNLLRCLVTDHQASWDLLITQAEFAYNRSVNRSTGFSSFEVVIETRPRLPLDLSSLPNPTRHSETADDFSQHIQQIHIEVRANSR